jgi:hypothetical protein
MNYAGCKRKFNVAAFVAKYPRSLLTKMFPAANAVPAAASYPAAAASSSSSSSKGKPAAGKQATLKTMLQKK